MRPIAVSPAILLACVVGACGSAAATPIPFRVGFPDAGTYTTNRFAPPLTVTIDDGWQVMFPDDPDEVSLEGDSGDRNLFVVSRVSQVVSPETRMAVDAPDDLVAWLQSHPSLVAGTPTDTTVDSLPAKAIELTNESSADVDLIAFPTGNFRVPSGVRLRVTVVPMEGADLMFSTGGPIDGFDAAIARTNPMLASLQIDDE